MRRHFETSVLFVFLSPHLERKTLENDTPVLGHSHIHTASARLLDDGHHAHSRQKKTVSVLPVLIKNETKQASKFQSDPSSNCFTIDV